MQEIARKRYYNTNQNRHSEYTTFTLPLPLLNAGEWIAVQ